MTPTYSKRRYSLQNPYLKTATEVTLWFPADLPSEDAASTDRTRRPKILALPASCTQGSRV
jgi:hypothetical protein